MTDLLHKVAFLGGIAAAARKYAPGIGTKLLTKGMGGEVKRQAIGGAVLGGALEGGLNAYNAEEGQKLKAFGQGAASGAAMGGVMGGLSGMVTAPSRNLRQHVMATKYGPEAAEASLKAGSGQNLKTLFGKTNPAMPRGAAAMEAVAAPATLAAEALIPAAALGAGEAGMSALRGQPQQPQPPAPSPVRGGGQVRVAAASTQPPMTNTYTESAEERHKNMEPLYVTPFTGAAGAALVDSAINKFHPTMSSGTMRKRILPAAGAAALTIPAVTALRDYNKESDPLAELDLEALKTYFGKQPAAH